MRDEITEYFFMERCLYMMSQNIGFFLPFPPSTSYVTIKLLVYLQICTYYKFGFYLETCKQISKVRYMACLDQ